VKYAITRGRWTSTGVPPPTTSNLAATRNGALASQRLTSVSRSQVRFPEPLVTFRTMGIQLRRQTLWDRYWQLNVELRHASSNPWRCEHRDDRHASVRHHYQLHHHERSHG